MRDFDLGEGMAPADFELQGALCESGEDVVCAALDGSAVGGVVREAGRVRKSEQASPSS